jgi:hypothetical protein
MLYIMGRIWAPGSPGYSPGLGPCSTGTALANFCKISVRRQHSPCPWPEWQGLFLKARQATQYWMFSDRKESKPSTEASASSRWPKTACFSFIPQKMLTVPDLIPLPKCAQRQQPYQVNRVAAGTPQRPTPTETLPHLACLNPAQTPPRRRF